MELIVSPFEGTDNHFNYGFLLKLIFWIWQPVQKLYPSNKDATNKEEWCKKYYNF